MKLYKIRDWNIHYENNRSRELKTLDFVLVPNSHDGENFAAIMAHKNGAQIFAAWVLILQVASKCDMRGTLLRGGGKPHNPTSLSLKTRAPENWFTIALEFLENETDWLVVEHVTEDAAGKPQLGAGIPQEGALEGKGREGKVHNGIKVMPQAASVLDFLNEKTGRQYRHTETNLALISGRLKEPGVTKEGVIAMIERQVKRWGNDPKMQEYLRPETLFGKSKFDGYYAAREVSVGQTEPNGAGIDYEKEYDRIRPGETPAQRDQRVYRMSMA